MPDEQQKRAFAAGEGDHWFIRNADRMAANAERDPLLRELQQALVSPTTVLEVGCSNGWRLEALRQVCGSAGFGVDPSAKAISDGRAAFPHLTLQTGTADSLPFENGRFDLVILGFCLYLCDRADLFRIAAEVDRVLADQGHLAILDFFSEIPYRNPYQHREGISAFKMDYAAMFAWNPAFRRLRQVMFSHSGGIATDRDDIVAVSLLQKDTGHAYVENPY
jgi:SAM-dependent methyltransferase